MKKSRFYVLVLAFFLLESLYVSTYARDDEGNAIFASQNNIVVMQGQKDFGAGSFAGTRLSDDGCIVLADKPGRMASSGVYESPIIEHIPFTELVMSWDADTPVGSAVIVEAQVRVNGKWSPWFSWGKWKSWDSAGSSKASAKDSIAKMDIDTLVINKGKFATALRYRVSLSSSQANITPAVKLLAAAVNGQQVITAVKAEKRDIVLDVPQYAQGMRDPSIAGRICSPVSVTMLLNYYGIGVIPEETAWNVFDSSQDECPFGNWPFNCAYAATFGLKAHVAYFSSLEDIRRELIKGRPVVASVMYKNSEAVPGDLPVVHNAPVEATDGHLVVVRGLVQKDGKEYVVVNDPAAEDSASVKRLYLAEEFEKAWTKFVYVVEKSDTIAISQPKRIPASLMAGKGKGKIALKYAGGSVVLNPNDIGSIVKLKSNQTIGFIQPEAAGDILAKQDKGCSILIITKKRQVFQVDMG